MPSPKDKMLNLPSWKVGGEERLAHAVRPDDPVLVRVADVISLVVVVSVGCQSTFPLESGRLLSPLASLPYLGST